jgi:hypothetical protein
MYYGGEIVIVRNIVFDNIYADHASLSGRPCIVLSEYNNKLTMLPMSSSQARDNSNTIIINKNHIERYNSNFHKYNTSYVNLDYMFQRDYVNYQIVALLTEDRYYTLLEEMEEKRLDNNPRVCEYYREIYEDLQSQKHELKRILKEKRY